MRYIFALLLSFSLAYATKAQESTTEPDSLMQLPEDTTSVHVLIAAGKDQVWRNADLASQYLNRALEISGNIKFHSGEIKSLLELAKLSQTSNSIEESVRLGQEGLALALSHDEQELTMHLYNTIGSTYLQNVDYPKAMENYQRSMELAQTLGDQEHQGRMMVNYALVYSGQGNNVEAVSHFIDALKLFEKDTVKTVVVLLNLSSSYSSLKNKEAAIENTKKALALRQLGYGSEMLDVIGEGNLSDYYRDMGKYDESLYHAERSLRIAEKIDDQIGISNARRTLGYVHYKKGNSKLAFENYSKALDISELIKDREGILKVEMELAEVLSDDRRYELALQHARKGLWLARNIGNPQAIRNFYDILIEVFDGKLMLDSAYYYHKQFTQLKDSLFGVENANTIANIRSSYELGKKEQEIENLAQQASIQSLELKQARLNRIVLTVVIIAILMLAAIFYLINRQRQLALNQQNQDMEQKLLRVQMNPHFIFNAMSAIQDYMVQGDAKQAGVYLTKFSKLIRQVLDNSRSEFISLDQEVSMLDSYMSLQNLRRHRPFVYEIAVEEGIDPEEISIPPMFAQPFVENAIEHGMNEESDEATIKVNFSLKDDYLKMKIEDNGVGIEESLKVGRSDGHVSHATQITKERVELFRRITKKNVIFDIKEMSPGTQVTFNLPFQYT